MITQEFLTQLIREQVKEEGQGKCQLQETDNWGVREKGASQGAANP